MKGFNSERNSLVRFKGNLNSISQFLMNNELSHVVVSEQESAVKSWLLKNALIKNDLTVVINKKLCLKVPLELNVPAFNSKLKFIPALLTIIGILGTFIGISTGLMGFDISSSLNSEQLTSMATTLLGGMSSAFFTSIFGLAYSGVFMFLIYKVNNDSEKGVNNLLETIAEYCTEVDPILYLKEISEHGRTAGAGVPENKTDVLAKTLNNIDETLSKLVNIIKEKESPDYSNLFFNLSETIKFEMKPLVKVNKEQNEQLKVIAESSSSNKNIDFERIIKQELITPLSAHFKENNQIITDNTKAVSKAAIVTAEVHSNLKDIVCTNKFAIDVIQSFESETLVKMSQMTDSLTKSVCSFQSNAESVLTRVNSDVETIFKSVGGFINSQNQLIKDTSKQIQTDYQAILERSEDLSTEQKKTLEKSASTITSSFRTMATEIDNAIDKRVKSEVDMFDVQKNSIERITKQAKGIYEQNALALDDITKGAVKLMQSAKTELESGLGDIDTKVTSMSTTVQSELTNFRAEYQSKLGEFLTQQNGLLEDSLGNQKKGLSKVVNDFKDVFSDEYQTRSLLLQSLTEQHNDLQKSAKTIKDLAIAIGLTDNTRMVELQDISITLGRQVGSLKKEYAIASKKYETLIEQMPIAMQQYFDRANSSYQKFFNDFDLAASKIHNKLANAAEFIIDANATQG
jgi:hypothetical protein